MSKNRMIIACVGPEKLSGNEQRGLQKRISLALEPLGTGAALVTGEPAWLTRMVCHALPGSMVTQTGEGDYLLAVWDGVMRRGDAVCDAIEMFVAAHGREKLLSVLVSARRNAAAAKAGASEQASFAHDILLCATSPEECKLAKRVARRLMKLRAPRSVERMSGIRRLKSVALSLAPELTAQDRAAIAQSRTLGVFCSPTSRLEEKNDQAIDQFCDVRGRKHVQAVLVEGAPQKVFPPRLLKEETYQDPKTGETVAVTGEPLASNFSGKAKFGQEILRFAAPLFGCSFDDLYRRRRQERRRRWAILLTVVLVLGGLVAAGLLELARQAVASDTMAQANQQRAQEQADVAAQRAVDAQAQTEAAVASSKEALNAQSMRYVREARLAQDEGNALSAIDLLLKTLPTDIVQREVLPDAEQLFRSLLGSGEVFAVWRLPGMTDAQVDGETLYSKDAQGRVQGYNLRTGQALGEVQRTLPPLPKGEARTLNLGDRIFAIDKVGMASLTDAQGNALDTFRAHDEAAGLLVSAMDGRRVVSSTPRETIVWGVLRGNGRRTMQAHKGAAAGLWVGDALFATCGDDGKAILFNLDGTVRRTLDAKRPLSTVEVQEGVHRAVLCSQDGMVSLWDIITGKKLWETRVQHGKVARLSPDGKAVVAGWRADMRDELMQATNGEGASYQAVLLNGDTGKKIASFPCTGVAWLGEIFRGDQFVTLCIREATFRSSSTGEIQSVRTYQYNNRSAATISRFDLVFGSFDFSSIDSNGKSYGSVYEPHANHTFLIPSPTDRQQFLSASAERTVMIDFLDDAPHPPLEQKFEYVRNHAYRFVDQITSCAFNTDGQYALATSLDGTAVVLAQSGPIRIIDNGAPILCGYFLRDTSAVVTVDQQGRVALWPFGDFATIRARAEELMHP